MSDENRPSEMNAQHRLDAMRSFLLRLLDPEDLGYAVTQEVRAEVQRLVLPRPTAPAAP
jgi:hypothetical protein